MGKGSKRRPTDMKKFYENHEKVFGKKDKPQPKKKPRR